MGHLKDLHGMTLLGTTPPGTCPMCAVKHDAELPHNQQSLAYQYKFYDANGRWPTWEDAMAHCHPEIKAATREILRRQGVVNIGDEEDAPEMEISIEIKFEEESTQ